MENSAISVVNSGPLAGMPQASSDDHLIEMWLRRFDSEATQTVYRRAIRRFLTWLPPKPLQQVTAVDLLGYQESFPPKWSDNTRNQHKAAIKSLWTYGCELQYFAFNIPLACYKLKKPRPVTAERVLTEAEMLAAIEAEPKPEPKLFLRFLYSTALRVSEALKLTWGDFHVRGESVFIQIQHGKGDQFAEISCGARVYMDLINAAPAEVTRDDPVFPIAYITAWRWVKASLARIGKDKGSPHWARHAHAVTAHENGASWHAISRQLRHAKPSFTMDRYGHFTGSPSTDFVDC